VDLRPLNGTQTPHDGRRPYSAVHQVETDLVQDASSNCNTINMSSDGALEASEKPQMSLRDDTTDQSHLLTYKMISPKTAQKTRTQRKRQRLSRPESVLQSIHTPARNMYLNPVSGKVNVSYKHPHRHRRGRLRPQYPKCSSSAKDQPHLAQPTSLYTILGRYLNHRTGPESIASDFAFTKHEEHLLRHKGFKPRSVEGWGSCLLTRRSREAVALFEDHQERPPLFVLLLFLRRQHISAHTFGVVLRHIEKRVKSEPFDWAVLKVLSVRLLRHARKQWPESIPWVSSLFCTEAAALFTAERLCTASARLLSDLTHFSNVFLLLLSLPATITPVLAAAYQERAQFEVLQFMASRTPAITVTRMGFRSVSRNQLAHPKTIEEKEWAELKGPSWPPWKENRTAMDEDKGYEYGASRASKILHRMYEAGYRGHLWEEMTEVYAGWDVDFSPTIQTRTSLPHISSQFRNKKYLTGLLWASRIRTTRTRREAWACFLAYELSGAPVTQHVYLAMFEKLHHLALKRSSLEKSQPNLIRGTSQDEDVHAVKEELLPGDMIETIPDPTSPLHYVYLSEPMPTTKELYHRMCANNIRPSNRLLAFLLESAPTFETCIAILETAKNDFDGGIKHLLSGHLGPESSIGAVPDYFFAAFIKCLCRFGRFNRTPGEDPLLLQPESHYRELRSNEHYLLEYAYALLSQHPPLYRPAWTTYMDKMASSRLHSSGHSGSPTRDGDIAKYAITWNLIESMQHIDLDVDDNLFSTVCTVTTYATQAATKDTSTVQDARHMLTTATSRLRTLFNNLVGAKSALPPSTHPRWNTIPPHIPSPAVLHAYVRALGVLRDYEGLYSFSIWLTENHAEVTARSEVQHSGSKLLFKTLVALRAAVTGYLDNGKDMELSPEQRDIVQLIVCQIQTVEHWGGWPTHGHVYAYVKGRLKREMPTVGGR
jgi:hypothetical protein